MSNNDVVEPRNIFHATAYKYQGNQYLLNKSKKKCKNNKRHEIVHRRFNNIEMHFKRSKHTWRFRLAVKKHFQQHITLIYHFNRIFGTKSKDGFAILQRKTQLVVAISWKVTLWKQFVCNSKSAGRFCATPHFQNTNFPRMLFQCNKHATPNPFIHD